MERHGVWRGTVVSGTLKGYEVELRVSGSPLSIYVIAYRHRRTPRAVSLVFAVGHEALCAHFNEVGAKVAWRTRSGAVLEAKQAQPLVSGARRASWRCRPRAVVSKGRRLSISSRAQERSP